MSKELQEIMSCSSCKNSNLVYAKGLCHKCYDRIRQQTHKEELAAKAKAFYESHKEEIAARVKAYWLTHKEEIAARGKAYRGTHKKESAAYKQAYYEAHREKLLDQRKAYYEVNKDQKRVYYEIHKEEIATRMKVYQRTERGKEVHRSISRKRRAIKASVDFWTPEIEKVWISIIEGTDGLCSYCDKYIGKDKLEQDHIIPISKSGLHHIDNVQPLCKSCNCSKGNRIE